MGDRAGAVSGWGLGAGLSFEAGAGAGNGRMKAPAAGAGEDQTAKVLELVNSRYAYARSAKEPMLEVWATCLAFYIGDQWKRWNKDAQRLVVQDRIPSWRCQPVYNQIPGIIDLSAAKLAMSRQLPHAKPDDDTDEADKERARKGTNALRGWWVHEGLDILEHEANVCRILWGAAFFHLFWDPHRLAKIAVPDRVTGAITAKRAPVGQLCVEVLTPLDVFPEPVDQYREAFWVIVAKRRSLHWFRSTFPKAGAAVEAETQTPESGFASLVNGAETGSAGSAPEGEGMATLKTYYERPSREFPKGRTVMVAGEVVLFQHGSLPLPHEGITQPLPVKLLAFRYVPTRLWPKGLIEECVSPQRELNRARGNISEWLRLFRGPKWFLDRGWKVDRKAITSKPDEVVEGNFNGHFPVPVAPPSMPGWLVNLPESERNELRHLAGQQEVSEGGVPKGVHAASAIQLLQGAENQRNSSPALLGLGCVEDLSAHALAVLAERYREPRMISVPTKGGPSQTATVQGSDFGPLEVEVQLADPSSDSDPVRQQVLADWLTAGILDLAVSPMGPVLFDLLREVGQSWLADAIGRRLPEVQQTLAVQAQQNQTLETEQQGRETEQRTAETEGGEQLAAGQANEAAEARAHQTAEAEAGRAHASELAEKKGVFDLLKAKLAGAGRKPK